MEEWKKCWREGFAPNLSTKGLEALHLALATDDPRLIQGSTTAPRRPGMLGLFPVEAACAIGFCGWKGDGLEIVAAVDKFFDQACQKADQFLGKTSAWRLFLNWYDLTPRDEMRSQLLAEVELELAERKRCKCEPSSSSAHSVFGA